MKQGKTYILACIASVLLMACGSDNQTATPETGNATAPKSMLAEKPDPMQNKGIGPITSVSLGEIDPAMVEEGSKLFVEKCSACHKADKKYIGPSPVGITKRRTPEWIMNMILNPEEMTQKDPIAKELLKEFLSPMANQSLTEHEARVILEYFRTL